MIFDWWIAGSDAVLQENDDQVDKNFKNFNNYAEYAYGWLTQNMKGV